MARLIGVRRDSGGNDEVFQKHQLPVFVEDMRTMVVEFEDPCAVNCGTTSSGVNSGKMSLKQFREKILSLSNDELRVALSVDGEHFNNVLLQLVPCVGCRRSVEKLYGELSSMTHPAVYPLTVTRDYILTLHNSYFTDIKLMYRLLILDRQKIRKTIESLTKCRKSNKRCILHSLDVHVCRTKISWDELWDLMSEDCRDECCVVEADSLLDMLETYLEKHRFCTECRSKVMKAYNLLVGDGDKSQEKGYNPMVYQGLRYCPSEQHLHLKPSVQYLNALIDRAEPELISGREKHAKTLDIAQGEVVTCLGLYMYDRLHRLVVALKTLQTTFQLLYCAGVLTLYSNFEEFLERKHGLSDSLERLCAELQDCAANPAQRYSGKVLNGLNGCNGAGKKTKKKPSKSASASSVSKNVLSKGSWDPEKDCVNCARRKSTVITDVACDRPLPHRQRSYSLPRGTSGTHDSSKGHSVVNQGDTQPMINDRQRSECIQCAMLKKSDKEVPSNVGDDDDGCSSGSSCCHDAGYCSQELSPGGGSPASMSGRKAITNGDTIICTGPGTRGQSPSLMDRGIIGSHQYGKRQVKTSGRSMDPLSGHDTLCSCTLLDMLQENDGENGTTNELLISPEDVKWFKDNSILVNNKRRALRERLLRQFRDMQERMQAPVKGQE